MTSERLPIALPIASNEGNDLRRSAPTSKPSRPGKTLSVLTPTRRSPRLSTPYQLSDRDRAVLRSVAAHRFLMTRHLEGMHFTGHATADSGARTARRVLKRLHEHGLLSHLQRRIGGVRAGSAGYVWAIGPVGWRLLTTGQSPRWRRYEPSLRLLSHYLAIADVHVALIAADGREFELTTVELEPTSWRHYLGTGGEQRLIRPDLRVVTNIDAYEDHWFLEVDLGTEHPPTIVAKCRDYLTYAASGAEQREHEVFPRVLWVVQSNDRQVRLKQAISRSRLDPAQFRVTTQDQVVAILMGGAA